MIRVVVVVDDGVVAVVDDDESGDVVVEVEGEGENSRAENSEKLCLNFIIKRGIRPVSLP